MRTVMELELAEQLYREAWARALQFKGNGRGKAAVVTLAHNLRGNWARCENCGDYHKSEQCNGRRAS